MERLLADGEWHSHERVIRDAMLIVPPEKAHRRAETARLRGIQDDARRRGEEVPTEAPPRVKKATTEEIIAAGARGWVVDAMVQRGIRWLEFEMREDGKKYVRLLRPDEKAGTG